MRRHRTSKGGPTGRSPVATRDGGLSRPEGLPLPPQPAASVECLLGRLHRIHELLVRRGFSDAVASRAVEEVLRVGLKALDTGKAAGMSAERRAGWLWCVALTAARRAAAAEPVCVSLEYEPPDAHVAPPGDEHDAFGEALREAVDCLPARQRQAVELHGLQGLSLRDAARQMGVRPSTVGHHYRAGLGRLASALHAAAGAFPREKFPTDSGAGAS
jgi:Sigma-70, region 4